MLQYFDTLTDLSGNALLGATVTVTNYPSGTLASIYSTNGTANPIANSVVAADITGQVSFYIPDGAYTFTYAYKATIYKTRSPVQVIDPMGFVAATDSGTANAYIVSNSAFPNGFATGTKIQIKALNTNTGASTLTVNGSATVNIVYPGGTALQAGSIIAGGIYQLEYDGTNFQLLGSQTAAYYPVSAAETAASITPSNFSASWGAMRRYGCDPLGVSDSSPGLTNAIAANDVVFDDYPGGGNYIFNSTVTPTRYPLRITGAQKNAFGETSGTRWTLQAGAGSNVALLHYAIAVYDFTIEGIGFYWATNTTGQFGLLFDTDCRSMRIRDCAFFGGTPSASTNVTAIKLTSTSGVYSGDVTIERNYISNVQRGIYLGAQCTTVRVLNNEMYSQLSITGTIGINHQASNVGVICSGNTIQQWAQGIYTNSGGIRQFYNYFEGNTTDFYWGSTGNNVSWGDINPGAVAFTATVNDATANVIGGGSYTVTSGSNGASYFDSQLLGASRGFIDKNTNANSLLAYGYWQTQTFAAGNFLANGSMTWTVAAGNVSTAEYCVIGGTMFLHLEVDSSTIGGSVNTQLIYTMPIASQTSSVFACEIRVNGTRQMAVAQTVAASKNVAIFVDATRATNWTLSTGNAGVSLNLAVRVFA